MKSENDILAEYVRFNHPYIEGSLDYQSYRSDFTHINNKPLNQQGNPLWGYCPNCGRAVLKISSPVGCKWCLHRLDWEDK